MVNWMPDTWGKAPMAVGVEQVAASRASSSWAPVTSMVTTVLPKGKTVFMSFMVISPAAMLARMPPPLVRAASTASSPRLWRACHSRASQAKSPRLVSWVRTPGSRSPSSSTSVVPKVSFMAAVTSSFRALTTAATSASTLVYSAALTSSAVVVSPSVMTTPTLLRYSPVETTRASPTVSPPSMTV